MGARTPGEIDAWLREGGLVVTASDRAARALTDAFHRARQAEGLGAWPAPKISNWANFALTGWQLRSHDSRLLLNSVQEAALWAGIAALDQSLPTLLEGPRHRLAALAMEAHGLLCSYAPRFLAARARSGWQQDAASFSRWLAAFDDSCRSDNLLSPSRLPLELILLLKADAAARPPLLLAGFDRILPLQHELFSAWGVWRQAAPGAPAAAAHFHAAPDPQAELAACALWCGRQLAAKPTAHLLVVTQAAAQRRGEIERAFLRHTGPAPLFEFSLGVPLSQVTLPRAAHMLLRWLDGPLDEQELDWLISTGHLGATIEESATIQAAMRALRSRSLERPQWTLAAFLAARPASLPAAWTARAAQVQRRLAAVSRPQSPLAWAELVPRLLEDLHFASARPLSSAEYQAFNRWRQAVDTAGSLGFDGRRIAWRSFLSELDRILGETLFAPESRNAPIQIAGPAESAGLTADALWFLGADEDAWPAAGTTHPLLPIEVQREAAMPHATPQLDWDLAQAITGRLLASAPEVHFSYAKQNESVEVRPSRLIKLLAGQPRELPKPQPSPDPLTVAFEDFTRIPFPPGKVPGGAAVLTAQSQCPFQAFAAARLGAQGWEPAQAGLTPSQRGQLLHAVLHSIWAGSPDGIRSHADLHNIADRASFVAAHVERALQHQLRPHLRERMPARYLELEAQRLTRLVTGWLEYEATRIEFEVAATEDKRAIHLAGLTFDLRLDRLDRLTDGSYLVVDYKSGDVSPSAWNPPRPEDVQLPLYAGFALDREKEPLGGLVFAKLRTGKLEFAGRLGDAASTLLPGLKSTNALVKNSLELDQLEVWRACIDQLARDFLAGRAEVDPRDYPKTCQRCGLRALCRIQENQALLAAADDSTTEEVADD